MEGDSPFSASGESVGAVVTALLDSDMGLVVQVKYSVMFTPRSLVLLIFSTLMVSGGVVNRVPPVVHHDLLCLSHILITLYNINYMQAIISLRKEMSSVLER